MSGHMSGELTKIRLKQHKTLPKVLTQKMAVHSASNKQSLL